jgi:hypothetical protein
MDRKAYVVWVKALFLCSAGCRPESNFQGNDAQYIGCSPNNADLRYYQQVTFTNGIRSN